MFCKNCGNTVNDKAIVCLHCGVQLNELQKNNSKDNGNILAIVGFVLSFFIAIAGLVCSLIGYNKAVKEGTEHKGLALAGIIISISSMALSLILYITVLRNLSFFFSQLGEMLLIYS